MSETSPESSPGDYSYDLAHETDSAGQPSEPRAEATRDAAQHAADGRGDQGGDYSYDLAHDVPPAGE
jgi:hypothetical protein